MIYIKLDTLEVANKLVKICEQYKTHVDIDVILGKYVVDGCSFLGVISLLDNIVKIVPNTNDSLLLGYFTRDIQEIGAWTETK
jgi:hypothetical protein